MTGLIFQILSCLSLSFIQNTFSYQFYLIAIYTAAAAFSGADVSFVNSHIPNKIEFREFMLDINGKMYKYTSFFILIGAFIYQYSPILTMQIQILCFLIALYSISKIPEVKKKTSFSKQKKELIHGLKFLISDYNYLSVLLIFSIFNSAILINHKTIQFTFTKVMKSTFSFESYWAVGVFYVIANLFSYNGTKYYKKFQLEKLSFFKQNLLFSILLVFSFALFSLNNFIALIIGFLVLNIFKSIYRPVLSTELSTLIPFTNYKTTILSLGALFTSVIASLLHILASTLYKDPVYGNLYFLGLVVPLLTALLYLSVFKNNWSIFISDSKLTGKRNYLKKIEGELRFVQYYSVGSFNVDHFGNLNKVIAKTSFPHSILKIENGIIVANYLGDMTLDRLESSEQFKQLEWIVEKYNSIDIVKNKTYTISKTSTIIEDLKLNQVIKNKLSNLCYWTTIHGDLHPENVMVYNNKVYFIDWDLSGEGWIWYDLLNLLTSPNLKIEFNQRIKFLKIVLRDLDVVELKILIKSFLEFKLEHFKQLVLLDFSFNTLIENEK